MTTTRSNLFMLLMLVFTHTLYSQKADCNFNNGNTCDWIQQKDDEFDWTVQEGPTSESGTGPDKGSDGGKYAYIKVGNEVLGDKATLILKDFEVRKDTECFSFKYHMHGRDTERLEVRQNEMFLLRLFGPQGNKWKQAKGMLPKQLNSGPPMPMKTTISISGFAGVYEKGDIAIDEIRTLPPHECHNITCPAFSISKAKTSCTESFPGDLCKPVCKTGYKLMGVPSNELRCLAMGTWSHDQPTCEPANRDIVNCNFEYDFCGWKFIQGEWKRRRSRVPDMPTGPTRDHTPSGGGRGFYIYADSKNKKPQERVSMEYKSPNGAVQEGCLQFAYFMHGTSIGSLHVYADKNHVFSAIGQNIFDDDDPWKVALGHVRFKELVFEVIFADGNMGNIAIDDIQLSNMVKSSCQTKDIKCPPLLLSDGQSSCSKNPSPINSTCSVSCNKNYTLSNEMSGLQMCLPFGTWDHYRSKMCNPLKYDVRLSQGKKGRLEVKYQNAWGTVCSDGWGITESQVVCKMLGHGPPEKATAGQASQAPESKPIVLDNVRCLKSDTSLAQCKHSPWGVHNCNANHAQDVVIECGTAGSNTTKPPIKGLNLVQKLVIGITTSVVLTLIVIIVLLCCYKRRKRRLTDHDKSLCSVEYHANPDVPQEADGPPADEWEVNPKTVTFLEELGQGAFGKVFKVIIKEPPQRQETIIMAKLMGTPQMIKRNKSQEIAAVKTLHEMADQSEKTEFLNEIKMMKKLGSHQNIVNFLYCCTRYEPYFLVVEYLPKGDLLKYLRTHRHKLSGFEGKETAPVYLHTKTALQEKVEKEPRYSVNPAFTDSSPVEKNAPAQLDQLTVVEDDTLTPKDLLSFSYQIAAGMEYLTKQGFVHRDLACRNVLVADNKQVKVSDFGLTRDLYEESAYHARVQRRLPIKWMSPEAIYDQVFTTESDVWAYGVTLWEITTLGGAPYPSMFTRDLVKEIRNGYRMEKPDMCSDEVYGIMRKCWEDNPSDRPSFTDIVKQFEELLLQDNPYLDFNNINYDKDYYLVPSFDSAQSENSTSRLTDVES